MCGCYVCLVLRSRITGVYTGDKTESLMTSMSASAPRQVFAMTTDRHDLKGAIVTAIAHSHTLETREAGDVYRQIRHGPDSLIS